MEKLSAAAFAAFCLACTGVQDGYIMGSRGQDPKKWTASSWWFTQYSGYQRKKALYRRANAARV